MAAADSGEAVADSVVSVEVAVVASAAAARRAVGDQHTRRASEPFGPFVTIEGISFGQDNRIIKISSKSRLSYSIQHCDYGEHGRKRQN